MITSMAWALHHTRVQTQFGMTPQRLVEGHAVFNVKEVKELGRKDHVQEGIGRTVPGYMLSEPQSMLGAWLARLQSALDLLTGFKLHEKNLEWIFWLGILTDCHMTQ